MFEGDDYPASLNDETFKNWLAQGVNQDHKFLLICWDDIGREYEPYFFKDQALLKEAVEHVSSEDYPVAAVFDLETGEEINGDELGLES